MKFQLVLLALLGMAVVGCQAPRSVVGTWTTEFPLLDNARVEFASDGRATLKGMSSQLKIGVEITGTYTSTEKELTLNPKDVSFNAEIPALFKSIAEKEAAKIRNRTVTGRIDWKSDSEFIFTPVTEDPTNPLSQTLTLKKQASGSQ